jgi:farnesyl diphosphate synthase
MILADYLAYQQRRIDTALDKWVPAESQDPTSIHKAMRYSLFAGGKRVRPLLAIAAAEAVSDETEGVENAACSLELIHTYSLIHDDLPALDNDDLRRGRPTCHKVFGDAMAILAGDALLTLAFGVLSEEANGAEATVRLELMARLSGAAGLQGMAGGQMLDLGFSHGSPDIGEIARMERMKTGELIAFSCEAGAILGRAPDSARHALRAYAHDLGLAYQIADDLLDAEGSVDDTGKTVGRDAQQGKATFVAQVGIEQARQQALMLAEQAAQHLDLFGEKAELLRSVADFVVHRRG